MKINKIVIKVSSRCNINCTYCYMYNLGDSSYKNQPKFMEEMTVNNFVEKLSFHCKGNEIDSLLLIIHGGEPLLMPKPLFETFIIALDSLKKDNIQCQIALQTNGVLLDDDWCTLFKKYNIGVGVSIDGPKEVNDINRIDKKNQGTFDKIVKGINVLNKNNVAFGILSVMNTNVNPLQFYNIFDILNIKRGDILFLDTNYDKTNNESANIRYSMFDWYREIFDYWYNGNKKVKLRIFDMIISAVLGAELDIDLLGTTDNNVLVLETNGDLEPVDALKICGESFTKIDVNINTKGIEDTFNNLLIEIYYNSGKYLPRKCLACPVSEICGGGYLPHRYSSFNGFNNPSVYCNDLLKLITHIQNAVIDSMPEEFRHETGIEKLTYENALQIIEDNLPTIQEPEYIQKLESFRKKEYANI